MTAPGPSSRVLVASVGLSPQVVTETLHALWCAERQLPDRLILLATPRAAALARAALLDPADGAIAAWGRDWVVPGADALAAAAEVALVETESGDVDAERGAGALSETAFRILAPLAADPDVALHVSIAGGRKPAAAILGILMSVLGRPQDRLSHVLVEPEGAAAAGLFYPAPLSRMVVSGGVAFDAAALAVKLVPIPFPRLARGPGAQSALQDFFDRLGGETQPVRLLIDLSSAEIRWDGVAMELSPAIAAFVAWIGAEQAAGRAGVPRTGAARGNYLSVYRSFAGAEAAVRAKARLADPLDPEWIEEKAARTNKLAEACGARPRGARLVQRIGARARAFYRLALDPAEIQVAGGAQ